MHKPLHTGKKRNKNMKKLQYALSLAYEIVDPETEEVLDSYTETEYFDTLSMAISAKDKHTNGEEVGRYQDGARAVLVGAEVLYNPVEVEYID